VDLKGIEVCFLRGDITASDVKRMCLRNPRNEIILERWSAELLRLVKGFVYTQLLRNAGLYSFWGDRALWVGRCLQKKCEIFHCRSLLWL